VKKALRIIGVIAVAVALLATIIISMTKKTPNTDIVWDEAMTMGNLGAKNYYIIYSDLACPYCIYFENPIVEHEEDFKKYIKEKDILVEIRLSDFLYEYGQHQSPASREGAIAAYCAKDEGRFWDYYNLAVHTIWQDFFRGGGAGFDGLDNTGKPFWINLGKSIGLSDSFEKCVNNDTPLATIIERAEKTTKLVDGMPYFKFNNYTFSGFNPNGDYEDVLEHMEAGLKYR